ncbi:hypothetical protein [Candidatus Chlorohelix sp.]|uniref:hypothetical protein n=1 Tax=Candidatus Chlorohelix sp. TaxID=3139201 RepID=UPI0030320B0E
MFALTQQPETDIGLDSSLTPDVLLRAVDKFNYSQPIKSSLRNLKSNILIDDPVIESDKVGALTLTGTIGKSKFLLKFPPKWNHELVLLVHGYIDPGTPISLEQIGLDKIDLGVLNSAFEQGFAYGYSTFGKVGYAVEEGAKHTLYVKKFTEVLGMERAYLSGRSMGGNITIALLEKYPREFAGALTYCGVMSGWYEQIKYLSDFRIIYDYFTKPLDAPIALSSCGDVLCPATIPDRHEVLNSVNTLFYMTEKNMNATPANHTLINIIKRISLITGVNPDPISYSTVLLTNSVGLDDYIETAGANGYSNENKLYNYPPEYLPAIEDIKALEALNNGVQRLPCKRVATAYLKRWYTPTGKFRAKLLAIHNLKDPAVPFIHELKLDEMTRKFGSKLVVWIAPDKPIVPNDPESGPGHCFFTPEQMSFAWNELRNWVEKGAPPASGFPNELLS